MRRNLRKTKTAMGRLSNEFREFLSGQLASEADALAAALEGSEPSVSVRINPMKDGGSCEVVGGATAVPWCNDGFYLGDRPDFTLDPAMHQGRYYVQDASSMVIWMIVRELSARLNTPGGGKLRYLDACAAPGGKTTAAMAALPPDAFVVANEFDFRRAEILKENVIKWGKGEVAVSRGDTARFRQLPCWFDIVAADVPCSGEGMMRKDVKACEQWSENLVRECAARQREIAGNLWEALRPGGYFIYSTCTFNRHENEDMLAWMTDELGAVVEQIPGAVPEGVVQSGSMWRFLPSRIRGEGLAIGVLRKPENGGNPSEGGVGCRDVNNGVKRLKKGRDGRGDKNVKGAPDMKEIFRRCGSWLDDGGDYDFSLHGDEIRALRKSCGAEVRELEGVLDLIYAGITVGNLKGRDVMPAHALAMSASLRRGAFNEAEVSRETALAYLRREAPEGIEAPRGAVMLTYGGWPLGFVNHLGNRSNNLYPQAWRIMKKC